MIDSALVVTSWASVIGGPLIWARLRGIREDKLHEALSRRMTAVFGAGEVGRRRSRRITFAIRVTGVGLRNRSSPGRRLLGIRWADAATGGPVPLHRMVAHELLSYSLSRAVGRINRPRLDRYREQNAETERRIEALRETLGDDPEALRRATEELHREDGTSCGGLAATSCALALIEPVTMLLSPRRQSLIERVTGVVVVRTRS
jgi:hypothetical protein